VRGILLRHYITHDTMAVANAKLGGGDWPGPAASLLTGSGAQVPDVRGLTPEAAKALLEGLGFIFADGGPVDSEAPAGKVVSTDPAPGSTSAKGATVTVFTSKGNKVAFPDVVADGQTYTYSQAEGMLNPTYTDVNEACVVVTEPARVDKVQASDPAPGAYVLPGAPVTLTVGKLVCPTPGP
jgi:beta-lactam-binding protein with PASTA domain